MKNQECETKIKRKSHHFERSVMPNAERGIQRKIVPSVRKNWFKITGSPRDGGSPAKHAQLLVQVKAAGHSEAQYLLRQLQHNYGNSYVQRVLDIAKKGQLEADVAPEVEQTITRKRGSGQPLDSTVRSQMEGAMRADFSGVKVHTDSESNSLNHQLNAKAFTTGKDVFFREGNYNPGSASGRELIAHELTHVVQQTGGLRRKMTLGEPGDRYEQEADEVARAVMQQEQSSKSTVSGKPKVQRQTEEEEKEAVSAKAETSGIQHKVEEEEDQKSVQMRSTDRLVQRQTDEGDKEDFEREKQEISVGVQAKHMFDQPTLLNSNENLMRARAKKSAKGVLTEEQLQSALVWYVRQGASYTTEVISQIQQEVGSSPDGVIGPFTVQAIAKWQRENGLVVDGKAGTSSLREMFGRDIRLVDKARTEEAQPQEEGNSMMENIRGFLLSFGFTKEQSIEVLSGKEPTTTTTAPESTPKEIEAKQKKRKYKLIKKKDFAYTLDGYSLNESLYSKMKKMTAFALDNDLVTGNIVFSSGLRSRKKAHRWSTAYQIRQGNVPLKKLAELPGGKDMDGNLWYRPGQTMIAAKANALKIWKGALAAEGYTKDDKKREPNTFSGGVTKHATGRAIDATFRWNWSKSEGLKIEKEKKVNALKAAIEKKWAKKPKKKSKVLAAINKFIRRGSYSEVASKTVEDHGLTRPVLHAKGSPEDWHYEEKK